MSIKRREKLNRLKKKRLKLAKKPVAVPRAEAPVKIENPYASMEEIEADADLMWMAWIEHYGELSEDFVPPLFEQDADGLRPAPWIGTYRDIMLEKYQSMEIVEPRVKFNLMFVVRTIAAESGALLV